MNPGFLWQSALERIRQRISPGAYTTWFRDTCGLALEGRMLTVGVANTFACEHLGQRFADLARVALSEVLGAPAQVAFVVHAVHIPRVERPTAPQPPRQRMTAGDATTRPAADAIIPSTSTPPTRGDARPTPRPTPRGQGAQVAHYGATAYAPHSAPTTPPPPLQPAIPSRARPTLAPGAAFDAGNGREDEWMRIGDIGWMAQPPLLRLDDAPGVSHTSHNAVTHPQATSHATPTQEQAKTRTTGGPRRAPTTPRLLTTHDEADPAHELRPGYRFETFVVGTANRLAFAAAQEVVRAPGTQYNPLLIYGGPGLGKTHLLHAIGHRALADGHRVIYVTAEQFTNELIEAIHQRATEAFRRRYRAVDVLLLDDAQWIAGREATEEEFFHTFNWLHEANKQIVLTSDCAPQAMRRLHDRLRSRFAWGLIADIQTPDMGQRLDILRAKAWAQALTVPEDALACLARPECASVRELEGKLTRVVAYARLLDRPLDAALVAQALAPLGATSSATGDDSATSPYGAPARRPVDAAMALEAVGRHFGVSVAALLGKSREHQVAWARQVAMYVLRETTTASLFQIGAQLGGRDHTTIMHGCARVSQALATDQRIRNDLAAIHTALGA